MKRFEESIAFLDALYKKPLIPAGRVGLQRISYLLGQLGDPHREFRAVHVAGSTGKGSTTTMVASILQHAGFRTGQFSSPHLQSIRERITIDGISITERDWEEHWSRVLPVVQSMCDNSAPGYNLGRPAYFEVLFALMACHFSAEKVEWAAVETGMGGRLDATNTLVPDVTVVTNIGLEHTQILGTTISEIAGEKAAIIKPNTHAVTAARHGDALRVIRERAQFVGVPLLEVPRDVDATVLEADMHAQRIVFRHTSGELVATLPSGAGYQTVNAATALGAALSLRNRGVNIADNNIVRGLQGAKHPGRFEILSRDPLVTLDGAHNPTAAAELRRAIEEWLLGRNVILLFSAMGDKDLASMAATLGPLAARVHVCPVPDTHRGGSVETIARLMREHGPVVVTHDTTNAALRSALAAITPDDALVICGSMYLVGYVRTLLASVVVR